MLQREVMTRPKKVGSSTHMEVVLSNQKSFLFVCLFSLVLGIEPRASHM
jgi:hypothetical protein